MKASALTAVVALVSVLVGGPTVAGPVSLHGKDSHRSKPSAPIDIRWLSAGDDGRVEIAVTTGVDHVGARLRLVIPGAGAPLHATLSAARAGEVQTVEWMLDRPVTRSPRLAIELDTGEAVIAKQVLAPPPASGKAPRRGALPVRPSPDLPAVPSDAVPDERRGEELITMPAEVTIRRTGD